MCSWFFGYCRHLAASQLCLCCSARPGGVSDKVSMLVGGVIRRIQQFYRGRGVPSSAVGERQ